MGAARDARLRKQRSASRHVQWLSSLLQCTAVHHTSCDGAAAPMAALAASVGSLLARVDDLERALRQVSGDKKAQKAEPNTKSGKDMEAVPRDEAKLQEPGELSQASPPIRKSSGEGGVRLRLRSQQGMEVLMSVGRCTPMQSLITRYCKNQGLQAPQTRFLVAGDRIAPSDTVKSLDLKDDCVIDVCNQIGGHGGIPLAEPARPTPAVRHHTQGQVRATSLHAPPEAAVRPGRPREDVRSLSHAAGKVADTFEACSGMGPDHRHHPRTKLQDEKPKDKSEAGDKDGEKIENAVQDSLDQLDQNQPAEKEEFYKERGEQAVLDNKQLEVESKQLKLQLRQLQQANRLD